MNRSELVEVLSKETGLTKRKAEEVVNRVFNHFGFNSPPLAA